MEYQIVITVKQGLEDGAIRYNVDYDQFAPSTSEVIGVLERVKCGYMNGIPTISRRERMMGKKREKHLLDEWEDKFDVQVQAERDGLMTFWQFAHLLTEVEHHFLTREGLRRYMEYTA